MIKTKHTVTIIGPFNSGTNLVTSILSNTIAEYKIKKISWKHKINNIFNLVKNIIRKHPNHLFIICYKSLYNWIESIEKCSYNINYQGITKPCLFYKRYEINRKFDTIIDIWNLYYQRYKKIITDFPNHTIVIDYHKLIDKDTCCSYLNNKFSKYNIVFSDLEIKKVLDQPSKLHGKSVKNSEEAKNKYNLVLAKKKTLLSQHQILLDKIDNTLIDFYQVEQNQNQDEEQNQNQNQDEELNQNQKDQEK